LSITTSGYEIEGLDTIFLRLTTSMKEAFPTLNINPDNLVYQWIKTISTEILALQTLNRDTLENINIYGASGIFLDKFGIDALVFRKQSSYANGTVECIGNPDDSAIPVGTTFSTSTNKQYTSTAQEPFSSIITMIRHSDFYDAIPELYSHISEISGLSLLVDGTNVIPSSYYIYTPNSDIITWIGSYSNYVPYGGYYYLTPSGSYTISVPVVATDIGTAGNTAANTITVNNNNLTNIISLTNENLLYNGLDTESDEDYRNRLIGYTRKGFTIPKIKQIVESVDGVKACKVYQSYTVDRSVLTDWTTQITQCTGVSDMVTNDPENGFYITGNTYYSFSFYPASNVSTLGGIRLYGRAMDSGNIPEVNVWIKGHSSGEFYSDTGYYLAKYTITKSDLLREHEEEPQDIIAKLSYNNMDQTRTYQVYIQNKDSEIQSGMSLMLYTTGYVSTSYRLDSFYSGLSTYTTGFIYASLYKAPCINIDVIPYSNYIFNTEVLPDIQQLLDYVDGDGFMPVGIQYVITEATRIYISLYAKIYIKTGFNFNTISSKAQQLIADYLDALSPGEDIVVAQIHKCILDTNGVTKVIGLKMKVNNGTYIYNTDERDIAIDENEYIVLDIDRQYDGITFIEG